MTREKAAKWTEKAIIWATCGLISGAVIWIGNSIRTDISTMKVDVSELKISQAEVTKELEVTKPADVLKAVSGVDQKVDDLDKRVLTKDDVNAIITANSPWLRERDDWQQFKYQTELAIQNLRRTLEEILQVIRKSMP